MRPRFNSTVLVLMIVMGFVLVTSAIAADLPRIQEKGAVWSTPGDGRLVMIARSAVGLRLPLQRVRAFVSPILPGPITR